MEEEKMIFLFYSFKLDSLYIIEAKENALESTYATIVCNFNRRNGLQLCFLLSLNQKKLTKFPLYYQNLITHDALSI